jgi:N-acyl-D-amino-acid deacylase
LQHLSKGGQKILKLTYLIKNGYVITGASSDSPIQKADIGVMGDKIVAVQPELNEAAVTTVNASGLYVSPGFIDAHSHSEFNLLADGRAEAKVCQGVVTEINGNCGLSAAPLLGETAKKRLVDQQEVGLSHSWADFQAYFALLEQQGSSLNFATLVGHGNLRGSTVGYADRAPSLEEQNQMARLFQDALNEGALGLSSGLIYPPGVYAHLDEVAAIGQHASALGGVYATHLRNEGDTLLEAIEESIQIASKSGLALHISHLKTQGEQNWHKIDNVLQLIADSQSKGLKIACDRYPYIASSTDLETLLPPSFLEGGTEKALQRLTQGYASIRETLLDLHQDESFWGNVLIATVNRPSNKWMEGRSLEAIAKRKESHPVDALTSLLIDEKMSVSAIFFTMCEENLKRILKQPYTMIGSDSSARSFDGPTAHGKPHPRAFGTFPRALGKYVREEQVLTLSEAIYKMTGLTAQTFGIPNRGVIAVGNYADLVIFDKHTVKDRADFQNPFIRPIGIYYVWVNGVPTLYEGRFQNTKPGRVLRRSSNR